MAINDYAFCQSKLSSINFPSTLVFMGEQPLASTQLTDVTLPENVPFINDGELAGCTKLKKLTIPSSVREVYAHALFNCTDLDSVIALGSVPPTIMDYYDEYDHPTYNVPSTTPMLVPKGSIEAYRKAGWDVLKLVESTVDPLKVVSTTPADSSLVNGYQNMSFDVVFDQNITLVNANPKVYIRKGYNYSAATVEPSGEKWHATVSGTKLSVWGADEDNFTDAFIVDDNAEYYITIPAGTVKAAKGSVNEQVSIFVYGKSAPAGIEGVSAGSSVNTKVVNRYNVAGQSVPSASRGIQIVKFSDGSVRKILIK